MKNKPGQKSQRMNKIRDELISGSTQPGEKGLCVSLRQWNALVAIDIFNEKRVFL